MAIKFNLKSFVGTKVSGKKPNKQTYSVGSVGRTRVGVNISGSVSYFSAVKRSGSFSLKSGAQNKARFDTLIRDYSGKAAKNLIHSTGTYNLSRFNNS